MNGELRSRFEPHASKRRWWGLGPLIAGVASASVGVALIFVAKNTASILTDGASHSIVDAAAARFDAGTWYRLDGVRVWSSLDADAVAAPNLSPAGHYLASHVWFGATQPGDIGSCCNDFTGTAGGPVCLVGASNYATPSWFATGGSDTCDSQGTRLYCLEQP